MASRNLSHQPPAFLAHFAKDYIGHNASGMETTPAAMPVPRPEIHPRQWMPDERDAFISWLRGEFAAANAMIDAMCQHLCMIGEPAEYDFVLACIQQRRYNWTVVLHMQHYFSVAEVVCALQRAAWQKQQARSTDLPRAQQACGIIAEPAHLRNIKREGSLSGDVATGNSPSPASSQKRRTQGIPSGDGLQSATPRADDESPEEKQSPRSGLDSGNEFLDLASSNSSPQNVPELPPEHQVQTVPANECSSSLSQSQDSIFPNSMKNEVQSMESDPNRLTTYLGRARSLDSGCTIFQQVYDTSHTGPQQSEPFVGTVSNIDFNLPPKEEEARLSTIKVLKQFQCWEQAEGKVINVVNGLELHENVLNKDETSQLSKLVTELQAAGRRGELGGQTFVGDKKSTAGYSKETIQFGYPFHEMSDDNGNPGGLVEPMPVVLQSLVDRLIRWHIIPENRRLDCCSINILEEGDHSPPQKQHNDLDRFFCCLSLMAECTFVLGSNISMEQHGDYNGPFKITLPLGSALILQGNSVDVASQAILASSLKRIMLTFGKVLASKVSNASAVGNKFVHSVPITVATTTWPPGGRQGFDGTPGARRGLVPTVVKQYSTTATSGVLPVPSVKSSSHVPQAISQHLASANCQPIFTNPTGAAGSYPAMGVMGQGWPGGPRPSRLPSSGTGVFFPSSGPDRPLGSPFPQAGVMLLPIPQKSDAMVAFTPTSEARSFTYPPNRLRPSASADHINHFTGRAASFSSSYSLGPNDPTMLRRPPHKAAVNASPKADANGNKNTKDDHQQKPFHHPKASAGGKV